MYKNRFGQNKPQGISPFARGAPPPSALHTPIEPLSNKKRTFRVDPLDYKPVRVGIKCEQKVIVVEYRLKSQGQKRFHHNIKVYKYSDPMAFGISVSRSGSFREALLQEIVKTTDMIYGDHCEYLPPERIERLAIEDLVR